jgi:molecular chaperone HtpG
LIQLLEKTLQEYVKQVRLSPRLTSSSVSLVVKDHKFSPTLKQALNRTLAGPKEDQVSELNANYDSISRMRSRLAVTPENPSLANTAKVLCVPTLLFEGSRINASAPFNRAVTQIRC